MKQITAMTRPSVSNFNVSMHTLAPPRRFASTTVLIVLCSALILSPSLAQTAGASEQTAQAPAEKPGELQAQKEAEKTGDAPSSEPKGAWVIAPIPVSSPAIGSGLAWVVGRVFPFSKQDKVSPPSMVGAGGLFTNNGSKAIAFGSRLYLKDDKYRVTAGVGRASINADIYGIGKEAGDNGVFVPANVEGGAVIGEFLFRLRKSVYVGIRGQYRNLTLSIDQEKLESDDDITSQPPDQVTAVIDQIRDQLLRQRTVSFGPRFQLDTRDNTFYPKHGVLLELASDFFGEAIGSKWSYQYYKAAFNQYNKLGEHHVIAFRGMGCAAAGERVPIYDLCLFGTMNDLRGYPGGRYQDRRMFATQAEYRFTFPVSGFLGRFGMVAFAGVGGVDKSYSEIAFDELLPAGGGGLRFRLTKKYPINFRADYARGKGGHTFSIGVMEAF